jgi:hypothetical protein
MEKTITKNDILKMRDTMVAEQATGIEQAGTLFYYDTHGNKITQDKARQLLLSGDIIEIPQAGAGSYNEVADEMGFDKVEVLNWSSSAGDWQFAVEKDGNWKVLCQENRYPHYGFKYSLSEMSFGSVEDINDYFNDM